MKKILTLLFALLMVGTASAQDKWFNFLRNGTLSEDPVGNFTNFTGRFGKTNKDEKGVVVDDPVDGQPALTLTTIAFNYQEEILDDEGDDFQLSQMKQNLYLKNHSIIMECLRLDFQEVDLIRIF